ncbi:MAG TPA: DUF3108 domain-containing protein [Magnetospirillaceae bacterium]|jgi:hypothetical protein
MLARRAALVLALAILAAGPARAAEPVTLYMQGWWGGLKGADIQFTIDEENGGWQSRFAIRGAGMVRWLTKLEAEAGGHGKLGPGGDQPDSYTQHVVSNKSERTVELAFRGDPPTGSRISDRETYIDPTQQARDPENVPDLPEAQRRDTMDPIAAILSLGHRAVTGDKHFTLPVYDGRRRFDLEVTVTGPNHHGLLGTQTNTIDAVAIVHPIGGFKPYHMKLWTNAKFDVYLDPNRGLPLQISSSSFIAAAVLTTKAVCPGQTSCIPADK